ncbi:MAG: hypothetical protein ACFFEF_01790 [Candidatus Thorarchaeota archaeon]
MHELREFEAEVRIAKRELKEVYYTTRDESIKADAKELVAYTITIQRSIKKLVELRRQTRAAGIVLNDQKAKLTLGKWKTGLTKRVKEYKKKNRKLKHEHLSRYKDVLLQYIQSIANELNDWIIDIDTMSEIPKPPE